MKRGWILLCLAIHVVESVIDSNVLAVSTTPVGPLEFATWTALAQHHAALMAAAIT
ncbi:Uncharacterized protein FKW44_024193, partial [Caligus rogercresseyi]